MKEGLSFTFLWFGYHKGQYKVSLAERWGFIFSGFYCAETWAFWPFINPPITEYESITMNLNSTFLSSYHVHKVSCNRPRHLVFEAIQQRLYFQIFIFFSIIHFLWGIWIFRLSHEGRYLEMFDFMLLFFWNRMTFVFAWLMVSSLVGFGLASFFLDCKRLMRIFNLVLTF